MTVASIEQSRASSARPGMDPNAAGDPAGLFALLMATLGVPLQMGGNMNGQDANLASAAASQPAVTGAAEQNGDAPFPNVPGANLPVLNTMPAGRLPSQAPGDAGQAAPGDFANLLATPGSAVPNPAAAPLPAEATASAQKNPGADTKGPTISAPGAVPAAPAFATASSNDAHESASASAHARAASLHDAVEKAPTESHPAGIDAANAVESADRASVRKNAEHPASPRQSLPAQTEIATAAPVALAPSRGQASAADRASDSASERPTAGRNSSAATVELPSVAVTAIDPASSSENAPKQSGASPGVAEAALGAPANSAPDDGALAAETTHDGVDAIGTRSADIAAAPRPTAAVETAPFRPEVAATPAGVAERTALQHVGAHITRAIAEGMDRLTLHLVPAELGRIDITLDVRDDGQVRTTVRADNPTTLDLLQRDSRNLERALESAGLRAEPGSLNFSLRNDGRQNQPFSPFQHDDANNGVAAEDGTGALPVPPARVAARGLVDLTI